MQGLHVNDLAHGENHHMAAIFYATGLCDALLSVKQTFNIANILMVTE